MTTITLQDAIDATAAELGQQRFDKHMGGCNDTRVDTWNVAVVLARAFDEDRDALADRLDEVVDAEFRRRLEQQAAKFASR